MKNLTLTINNPCLNITRIKTNQILYEFIACTNIDESGYILCAQNPFRSTIAYEEEFRITYE